MKAFVLCGCVLTYIFYISAEIIPRTQSENQSRAEELLEFCLNQVNLTRDEGYEVDDIINEVYKQPGMEEKRRKHGCFIECLLKKLDWMEGSQLMEERIYGNISKFMTNNPIQEKAQQLVRQCAQEVRNTTEEGCEKGFTAVICAIKNMQEWKHLIDSLYLPSSAEENELNT